tara:strand:- start:118 stop:321 length:204 start_codon:yes stop_codon:yes gene_type:complete
MTEEIAQIDELLSKVHTYLTKLMINSNDTDSDDTELEGIEDTMNHARNQLAELKCPPLNLANRNRLE